MPETALRIRSQLGLEEALPDYESFVWGGAAGAKVNKAEVLFARIDIAEWKKERGAKILTEQSVPAKAEAAVKTAHEESVPEHEAVIDIDQFRAVEMRVAQIIKVEEVPKSKKLYKLEVDLGYEKRTVCSGIKAFFKPEELENRRVVMVTNLKPAKLCGIESNGMILAASVKTDGVSEQLTLIVPASDIPLGSRVS